MDGVHDLGGREGFGKLPLEENEPIFHHDWEGRVVGIRSVHEDDGVMFSVPGWR